MRIVYNNSATYKHVRIVYNNSATYKHVRIVYNNSATYKHVKVVSVVKVKGLFFVFCIRKYQIEID